MSKLEEHLKTLHPAIVQYLTRAGIPPEELLVTRQITYDDFRRQIEENYRMAIEQSQQNLMRANEYATLLNKVTDLELDTHVLYYDSKAGHLGFVNNGKKKMGFT